MDKLKAPKKLDCELLLLLFAVGALSGTIYRKLTAKFLLMMPGSAFGCFVLVLVLDASMTASLFSWLSFPTVTIAFGAVAAEEASELMSVGVNNSWQRLLVLTVTISLHFLLSVCNMRTAGILRQNLRGSRRTEKIYLLSFLLMSFAYLICASLIYLRFQAKI